MEGLIARFKTGNPVFGSRQGARKRCQPKDRRLIIPNHLIPSDVNPSAHPNKAYASNRINTTKYTILTFLPKNLFEQFHRVANLYFIFIVLLNFVPEVNAFAKEIAMCPVLFVLGVTALKDGFEDYRRYKADKEVNKTSCRVYSRDEGRYARSKWSSIKVGDVVHLSCNEVIPADILLLHSSDEQGICHIETANIDGENNLKQREVVRDILQKGEEFNLTKFRCTVECEHPNPEIYKFHGSLIEPTNEHIPLNKHNVVLRGCVLRNTDFVEGLVVYAGHETKAMLNNRGPRYKRSQLERQMNKDVMWCVVILLILCFSSAIGSGVWLGSFDKAKIIYVQFSDLDLYSPLYQGFIVFWTYVIIYQVMIPLPLYVTMEIVKLGQSYFINQDMEMYDPDSNKRIECRALNIPEELGQVQYIFSDKTGTLTENKMVFKCCTIGGIHYPHTEEEDTRAAPYDNADQPSAKVSDYLNSIREQLNKPNTTLHREVSNMSLESLDFEDVTVSTQSRRIHEFFLLMAICNTVVVSTHAHEDKMDESGLITDTFADSQMNRKKTVDRYTRLEEPTLSTITPGQSQPTQLTSHDMSDIDNEGSESGASMLSENTLKTRYEAESPDELALVKAACTYGCRLLNRTYDRALIWLPGEGEVEFEILHVLPFDTVRKRMSVIVKHPISREVVLYCKGADNTVLENLDSSRNDDVIYSQFVNNSKNYLTQYAKQGLRTLVMAKRVLSHAEYHAWLVKYREAECAMAHREKKLMQLAFEIEVKLELLGATGVEDRLQEGVPETIEHLQQAGIKLWVLTGDKMETALNIAFSCKLISFDQQLITINAKSQDVVESLIKTLLKDLTSHGPFQDGCSSTHGATSETHKTKAKSKHKPSADVALVIDGKSLSYAMHKSIVKEFLKLSSLCSSVLICRATPGQKAQVVRVVRDQLNMLTLAIGDGANDVSMIQTANIGIGISGQEGKQAVMASDFAMAKFRFLERLLLVHGHWCYDRLARITLHMFYKSTVLIFLLFWYQMFNGFSGSVLIDQYVLMLFNVAFTAPPPFVIGIFDRDLPAATLLAKPRLYKQGPRGQMYKPYSFFIQISDAVYQSLAMFFVPYMAYHGSSVGIWEFGSTVATASVIIIVLCMGIETKSWTWVHWTVLLASVGCYYVFALPFAYLCLTCGPPSNPYHVILHCLTDSRHWLTVILTCAVALLPRFTVRAFQGTFYPSAVMKARIKENYEKSNGHGVYFATWSSGSSSCEFKKNTSNRHDTAINDSSLATSEESKLGYLGEEPLHVSDDVVI